MIEIAAPEMVEFRIGDDPTVYRIPRRDSIPFALVDKLDMSGETQIEKAKAVQNWVRLVIDHYNGEGVSDRLDIRGLTAIMNAAMGAQMGEL